MTAMAAASALRAAVPVEPYEMARWSVPLNAIDQCVAVGLSQHRLQPANPCSDEVFLRRIYIDLMGILPEPKEVQTFLADRRPDKRAALIETVLARPEYADYWTLRWSDILRIKAEFPINLWPNAAQAYHHWVRDAIEKNLPYDQFVRALLTSSGSNFRVGPVNFYRALQGRDAPGIAEAVGLTFMGTRLANWPEARRADLANFFTRLEYKHTDEWKEEIVCLDPKPAPPLKVTFPDGKTAVVPPATDPRAVLADWLIRPDNPWFATAIANRVWYWLMGRGVIQEPDDLRDDNPPSNPQLLNCLQNELVRSKWDLRQLMRLILNSRTYQQSSIPQSAGPEAEAQFACYAVRRLDAEVLADALKGITGAGDTYSSQIPEPFTYMPMDERSVELPDGSISSPFLEMFGKPARDTGLENERNNKPSDSQRLYLLNGNELQSRLEKSPRLRALALSGGRLNPAAPIYGIYEMILSRNPTNAELATVGEYFRTSGDRRRAILVDLAWALINSKEFLYRH
jgi:hypothetical protein